MLRSIFPITSDIYLIIPAGSAPALPVTGRPYTVSVLKTEKWLLKNGFSKLPGRGKGDHERYERPDGLQVGLDRGALELSRNIERSIAQQLGVSQREFRTAVSEGRRL
jgi:predicted RNA binding protein YcfA (HicA-like mRNA interferase family)